MKDTKVTRRQFSKTAGVAAAGLTMLSTGPFVARARNTNSRHKIGVIGTGGKGGHLIDLFQLTERADIVAVCDVYGKHRDQAVEKTYGRAKPFKDFRKLLEDPEVEAVIVATPDHWHALPTIRACEAGKDVYVEKPLSFCIAEGQKMVEAARAHNRIVQAGTQQRSGPHFREVVERVQSGELGPVTFCRTWYYENIHPRGIGNPKDGNPPPDLDWDFWQGPAPERPYNPNRCIYNFRWFKEYAFGKTTDWGVHLVDIVHWAMGVKAPESASATGGKFALQDNRNTPDTLTAVFRYPSFILNWETRSCNTHRINGDGYGIAFHGTEKNIQVDRDGYKVYEDGKSEPVEEHGHTETDLAHARHFLDNIEDRTRPVADVEDCYYSTLPPLLARAAYEIGRTVHWDEAKGRFRDDPEADGLLMRPYREPWAL